MATYGGIAVQSHAYLGLAARKLRDLTDVAVSFRGVCTNGGRTFTLGDLQGARTKALNGLSIQHGSGVGGKAMANVRPIAVDDYERAGEISHQYDRDVSTEGIRAMFAVPVRNRSGVLGVLYGGFRTATSIGDAVIATAVRVAREAEFQISVEEAVQQRLTEAETSARSAVPADEKSVAREHLRQLQAELLEIANGLSDESARRQLCDVSRRLTDTTGPATPGRTQKRLLSSREMDVLIQVAVGCSNREVAQRLSILPTTAKSYLQNAMRKLNATNRVEAICTARRLGIIP